VTRAKRRESETASLRRELRQLRAFVARLTRALYTHTRTDIAPDAALPAMKRMVREIGRKR
jgi:hypothetical protein